MMAFPYFAPQAFLQLVEFTLLLGILQLMLLDRGSSDALSDEVGSK
ncbi:hypothetical protein HAALTHF_20130n [Vreelandella aquamarina]|nr:hypothetical protein HAALTHF_20130n [Halomonas axialensis]